MNTAWGLFDELVAVWDTEAGWKHRKSHIPVTKGNLFVIVAVDATPWTWAVNVLTEVGVVESETRQGTFRKKPIAEAEAFGAEKGLLTGKAQGPPVIALCNDNTAIGRGIWKGYSADDALDPIIEKALRHLKRKVYVGVDVPSAENYADIGTRSTKAYSDEEVVFRRKRTVERAIFSIKEWMRTGVDYYSRDTFDLGEEGVDEVFVPEYDSDDEGKHDSIN